ncbi:MAG: hypothetical protein ACOCVF_02200 [bacterium]
MKKTFLIIITTYILITAIIIIVKDKDIINEINILTVKKAYSRIITPEEVIDIPIFFSEENNFLIDKDNIIDARIKDEHNEVEINIEKIENAYQKTTYENISYFMFYYQIKFNQFAINNLQLNLENSYLEIIYQNETNLQLEIGDLNLLFTSINNHNHIDFTRMYSITNYENNHNVVKAIYLELENLTGNNIYINSISLLNNKLFANTSEIKTVNFLPEYNMNFNSLLPEFNSIANEFKDNDCFIFKDKQNLIIPINHLNKWQFINRFPLIIDYSYNEENYQYIIDDYLFFSSLNELGNLNYEKSIYNYTY